MPMDEAMAGHANAASALLVGADDIEQLDLARIEAGIDQAQIAGWTLQSTLEGLPDAAPVTLEILRAYQALGKAVLGAYPVLQRLELDMLRDRLRDGGAVTESAMAKVSSLRGRSLAASRAVHRGLLAAYSTHDEAVVS